MTVAQEQALQLGGRIEIEKSLDEHNREIKERGRQNELQARA